ncbi:response regulator receiver modulated diguanylate cyclase [Trichormus variabilis ATCC 29413]|uniref:Response regulator receiver modulated diguanylate cyclase n=2 Tax=Anabaena variabilis TaxID=264691 RepID=Q3MAE8_TRIV2|nr:MULTISPECIES: response regulator [Nostocaceae]ABA22038.1 response regulator receiver modulated diguanylate cyclase [Trichormus variabilis ATCC 29413]MBC1213700.1 response regulator [Trichormus variabilis ARAD]MBC1257209.1 response regulator [Trichormus variabilis V5]MBC1266933.1 response regulator [Trichormus variabilis FSR]MBC1303255.1 response regulator [Trichormus variabilis N2B]
MRILLVEDDELIGELLVKSLTSQHYTVDFAKDGEEGWNFAELYTYDLILLDLILPKLDGISFCRQLRASGNQTPVLLLTSQDTSITKVAGLDAGADDYVAKPFDFQELLARIRALLRRGGSALPPLLEWNNLRLDPSTCEVACDGKLLHLTPKEYGLLELFLRNSHRIFSCSALIDQLWSFEEPPTEDTVRSHIKGLRQKLKAAGVVEDPIDTVYGIGYRLKPVQSGREEELNLEKVADAIANPVENEVRQVWKDVVEKIEARVAVIEQASHKLLQNKVSEEILSKAKVEAHKLAGSLGMFGSDEGSQIAQEIESLLDNGKKLKASGRKHLGQVVEALHQELENLKSGYKTEPSVVDAKADDRPLVLVIDKDQELVRESRSQSSEAIAPGQLTQARVMIVDDDPQILTALQTLLSAWGIKVYTLAHSQGFLEAMALAEPELLILKMEMPSTSGIELCQIARQEPQWAGLPILFLTNRHDTLTRQQIFIAGADDYISKPIVEPELIGRILNRLEHNRWLQNLAEIDTLTLVANRRKSTQELNHYLQWCHTHQQTMSFAVVELDGLKQINYNYGHEVGDRILSQLGELLRQMFHSQDVVGRWGGTEFILGMAGITKGEGVRRLGELLKTFRQIEFITTSNQSFHATFSAAVVEYPQDGDTLEALYQAADIVLNQAKTSGRDRVLSS